jgi:hypothetical protein
MTVDDALMMNLCLAPAFNRTAFGVACLSFYTLMFFHFMPGVQSGVIIIREGWPLNHWGRRSW